MSETNVQKISYYEAKDYLCRFNRENSIKTKGSNSSELPTTLKGSGFKSLSSPD